MRRWITADKATLALLIAALLLSVAIYYLAPARMSQTDRLTAGLVILTPAVVFVTYWYARITNRIAETNLDTLEETRRISQANEAMVTEAQRQRQMAARPVVAFALHPAETEWDGEGEGIDPTKPTITRFQLEVRNVGSGPALNVTVDAEARTHAYEPGDRITRLFRIEEPLSPFALGVGHSRVITYRWRRPKPDLPLQGEEAANYFSNDLTLRNPVAEKYRDDHESINRLAGYWQDLLRRPVAYQLEATYADVYDNVWVSRAPLEIPYNHPAEWASEVRLGNTTLDGSGG